MSLISKKTNCWFCSGVLGRAVEYLNDGSKKPWAWRDTCIRCGSYKMTVISNGVVSYTTKKEKPFSVEL